MKQKQNLIFIILMGILFFPLNVWSGGTESALSGYYTKINGSFDRVYSCSTSQLRFKSSFLG